VGFLGPRPRTVLVPCSRCLGVGTVHKVNDAPNVLTVFHSGQRVLHVPTGTEWDVLEAPFPALAGDFAVIRSVTAIPSEHGGLSRRVLETVPCNSTEYVGL